MKRLLVLLLLLSGLLAAGVVLSAPNSSSIPWWTVDGGGAVPELSGGSYSLLGTTGQADAGISGNGRYTLDGGFWNPATSDFTQVVYLPVVIKP